MTVTMSLSPSNIFFGVPPQPSKMRWPPTVILKGNQPMIEENCHKNDTETSQKCPTHKPATWKSRKQSQPKSGSNNVFPCSLFLLLACSYSLLRQSGKNMKPLLRLCSWSPVRLLTFVTVLPLCTFSFASFSDQSGFARFSYSSLSSSSPTIFTNSDPIALHYVGESDGTVATSISWSTSDSSCTLSSPFSADTIFNCTTVGMLFFLLFYVCYYFRIAGKGFRRNWSVWNCSKFMSCEKRAKNARKTRINWTMTTNRETRGRMAAPNFSKRDRCFRLLLATVFSAGSAFLALPNLFFHFWLPPLHTCLFCVICLFSRCQKDTFGSEQSCEYNGNVLSDVTRSVRLYGLVSRLPHRFAGL